MDALTRTERLPELLLELTDTLGADFDTAGLLYGLRWSVPRCSTSTLPVSCSSTSTAG